MKNRSSESYERPDFQYESVWIEIDGREFDLMIALEDDGIVGYAYFHRVKNDSDLGMFKSTWLYNVVDETPFPSYSIRGGSFVPPNCKAISPDNRIQDDGKVQVFGTWNEGGGVTDAIFFNGGYFLGCCLDDSEISYSPYITDSIENTIQPLTAEIASQFNPEMIRYLASNGFRLPSPFDDYIRSLNSLTSNSD